MRNSTILAIGIVAIFYVSASATIIHVPDDYGTIQEGIDASTNGDTVLVQPDTYVENINFNGHNIVLGSLFLITEDTSYISQTVIDGDSGGSVVTFENQENEYALLKGFTITNGLDIRGGGIKCWGFTSPTIKNNIVINNYADTSGGGIYCYGANPIVINNSISFNFAMFGGGIDCDVVSSPSIIMNLISSNNGGGIGCWSISNPNITNNVIKYNIRITGGAGVYCGNYSNPIIINNTLFENSSALEGAGIYCNHNSDPQIVNSILWNDTTSGVSEIYVSSNSMPVIAYCNIQGGWEEGEDNIDVVPLFRDPDNGGFHLMATYCGDPYDSPCIDMGHPDILDSLLDCDWGLGEPRSDMGAYGGGEGYVNIEEIPSMLPEKIFLFQNYPNPFNASTSIQYNLSVASDITIDIYDILGRKVETLINQQQPAGYHQVIWNAEGKSTGLYFYKIQAGDYIETKKMVLLK